MIIYAHFYSHTKTKKAINELARQYTGIKTIQEAHVQALNNKIHFVEGRMLTEWTSKRVMEALTAIAPTVTLILSRGKGAK